MSNPPSLFPPPPDGAEPGAMEEYINNMGDDHRAAILFAVITGGVSSMVNNKEGDDEELSETEAIIFTLATVANWPYERARKALMGAMVTIAGAYLPKEDPADSSGDN